MVNAQTTYANLLQFEIESKRLLGTNGKFVNDSTGRLLRQRKKVSRIYFKSTQESKHVHTYKQLPCKKLNQPNGMLPEHLF